VLLDKVDDAALRKDLLVEIERLRAKRNFGLVFEAHLPERVRLPEHYVDDTDAYRHSKWLAFMERRLLLAKQLLNSEDSVLIVTIDEKEVHRLALLVEQLFPSSSRQLVTIVINPASLPSRR
jgi:adenine specific DNA methylase Mod